LEFARRNQIMAECCSRRNVGDCLLLSDIAVSEASRSRLLVAPWLWRGNLLLPKLADASPDGWRVFSE
jgi:hypothetical protein